MPQHLSTVGIVWLGLLLIIPGCEPLRESRTDPSVAFVVYDAGETLGLLPVAAHLRSIGLRVRWVPLTPWSAALLAANGETFLVPPDGAAEMPHVGDRWIEGNTGYWEAALLEGPAPALAVLGMVSAAQGRIAARLGAAGVPIRGFHDGFQPPTAEGISPRTAHHFEEIWVPTARVQKGFRALGIETVVVGQPSLEAWRRTAEDVDPHVVDLGVAREAREGTLAPLLAEVLAAPRSSEAVRAALADAGFVVDADLAVADRIRRAMGG